MSASATIRPARVSDVRPIAAIVNDWAERGRMLHRSFAELFDDLRDYQIAEVDGEVVGVVGLRVMWSNLAECYALAVKPECKGMGLGRKLVEASITEAERLGIRRVFSLTYERAFFEKLGFVVVDRHANLPLKVWSECARCPKKNACDEIAMVYTLEHVADPEVSLARPKPDGSYEVPVLSESMRRIEREAAGE